MKFRLLFLFMMVGLFFGACYEKDEIPTINEQQEEKQSEESFKYLPNSPSLSPSLTSCAQFDYHPSCTDAPSPMLMTNCLDNSSPFYISPGMFTNTGTNYEASIEFESNPNYTGSLGNLECITWNVKLSYSEGLAIKVEEFSFNTNNFFISIPQSCNGENWMAVTITADITYQNGTKNVQFKHRLEYPTMFVESLEVLSGIPIECICSNCFASATYTLVIPQ